MSSPPCPDTARRTRAKAHLLSSHGEAVSQDRPELALWGGVECTLNRVGDSYFDQIERSGHLQRPDDLELFASLGISALRYPVLWEAVAPAGMACADWRSPDERMHALRALGVTPIVGLVHHGSGPRHTSLVDSGFATGLADFAGAVSRRYPWVEYYTPVNEPLTTARFSGLYGVWYPHGSDDPTFVRALLNQCRAIVLSMRAIREVNPAAKLVQTDDLGRTFCAPGMDGLAAFYNERRWLAWDLLCGTVGPGHAMWRYLIGAGIEAGALAWFGDNPCPPDIIGINHYITSDRWLDSRVGMYPRHCTFSYGGTAHVDIEASRIRPLPAPGVGPLLLEAWERYRLPLAVTETHTDAPREDQMRWLLETWTAAMNARASGADVRAVTAWALLGSFDWNCLVTACHGYYESGAFDIRSRPPRPTAIAALMRALSSGRLAVHPAAVGHGLWKRPGRLFYPPEPPSGTVKRRNTVHAACADDAAQPLLIIGATGTLGSAFGRICERRDLAHRLLDRRQLDIGDPVSIERAIVRHRPWAIINAGGYVRVDEAETDTSTCWRENALGPSLLAAACSRHDLQLLTFSSDLVFDGTRGAPYIESDRVSPLSTYGASKAHAERKVLSLQARALVIRTSAFFGPWDRHNFLADALSCLARNQPFQAAGDLTVSPTYVPDLVHACLDLLIDGETGLWHLTNGQALRWDELALRACAVAGVDASRLESLPHDQLGLIARRPRYSALTSERAILLPALEDALRRYLIHDRETADIEAQTISRVPSTLGT